VRAHDPEATALLDNDAVRAAMEAVAREQQGAAPPARAPSTGQPVDPRRPATSVSGRGGARSIDE
jgi:hypothetical protein